VRGETPSRADFDSDDWAGLSWHKAAPASIPPEIARSIRRTGVSIVLLGEGDDDHTAFAPDSDEQSLRWIAHTLDRRLFDLPHGVDVTSDLPSLHGSPRERWAMDDWYTVRGQRELLDRMAVPGGHGDADRFEWWVLREDADLSWVAGSWCMIDGHLIEKALTACARSA